MTHSPSPKRIGILGSTGSIGTQALDVVRLHPERFEVKLLTAQRNVELLASQIMEFEPELAVITEEGLLPQLQAAVKGKKTRLLAGNQALEDAAGMDNMDLLLTAVVGYVGLLPTLAAIRKGTTIALANKETLVVAGELVMEAAKKYGVDIIPVDSEHSALFQSIVGESPQSIDKLILTASGGPFRGMSYEELRQVTKAQALKHPNWDMGAKITIDSASMMNKGLEVIEARWLFDVPIEQIEVVVHPQSIIHSLVQFVDGSIKAQLGLPDMRLPIQYALAWPDRIHNPFERFEFTRYPKLDFERPDPDVFRNLALAFMAAGKGGNLPCILNAANEIAVAEFLQDSIRFVEIPQVVEHCMEKMSFIAHPQLEDYIQTDRETRIIAKEYIK
jgi:1-deoxy-D-xylulose-5-phosphate reductoisomerase